MGRPGNRPRGKRRLSPCHSTVAMARVGQSVDFGVVEDEPDVEPDFESPDFVSLVLDSDGFESPDFVSPDFVSEDPESPVDVVFFEPERLSVL